MEGKASDIGSTMAKATFTGQCLCGAVTVTADAVDSDIGACHCDTCRQWGGGPLMTADTYGPVSFNGEDNIGVFSSSDWAERGFCKQCGTHLFYRLKHKPFYALPAGLLGKIENAALKLEVFIDQKPDFYSFREDTKCLTGQQMFELFGAD